MSRVLITAGAGTIGQALMWLLLEMRHQVVILDTRPLPPEITTVPQVFGRANDEAAFSTAAEGCDHIFHLEWRGSVHRTTVEPIATNNHNTVATLLALETARRLSIPLTFTSTCVYRGDVARPATEDDPKSEKSLYVAQKLYAENCVRAYAQLYGLPTCSLRVFNVYGGRDPKPFQIIPRLLAAIRSGEPIKLTGDGGQIRDFVNIVDVARALVSTLDQDLQGGVFNVGTGVGTSMLDLSKMVMDAAGKSVPIEFIPAKSEESRYLIADTTKSERLLGFRAVIGLRESLTSILPATRSV